MQMTAAGVATDTKATAAPAQETSTIATLQSLIVAFVLAMAFRGFVTEGFVIPTGSMAPTLMGEHLLLNSGQTGLAYPVDSKGSGGMTRTVRETQGQVAYDLGYSDPMLGREYQLVMRSERAPRPRMGDRILVLKSLYPFAEPDRFDVVVFKNPTDPDSDAENYIKRLVGLPGESIWLADGDVFVAPADQNRDHSAYSIRRKPEHIQAAVWQPVHDSDYVPLHPELLSPPYAPSLVGHGLEDGRAQLPLPSIEPATLSWDSSRMPLTDWTPYNLYSLAGTVRGSDDINVSDLRVAAGIVADDEGLTTTLDLETRGYLYEFSIGGGRASMRMRPLDSQGPWTAEQSVSAPMPAPGRVYNVEFWHVDQAMSMFVNGRRLGPPLEYEWGPRQRIEQAFGRSFEFWAQQSPRIEPIEPKLTWIFTGSPVTLHRVRVDRDLYYRPDTLTSQATRNATRGGFEDLARPHTPAFGTHPDKLAVLGPDHYLMLGDNSPASSDSRLWGYPHPYVAEQVDPAPFVVHRKLLLGKAWVVYFPAPYPLSDNSRGLLPDFGNLRFIR